MTPHAAAPDRYDTMTYRRCGRSGLDLPGLSLGLWHNFGHAHRFDTQRAILLRAFDLGITHIDLANAAAIATYEAWRQLGFPDGV